MDLCNTNNNRIKKDFNTLNNYLKQFPSYRFLDAMSDFHLLLFLYTNQTVHFDVMRMIHNSQFTI